MSLKAGDIHNGYQVVDTKGSLILVKWSVSGVDYESETQLYIVMYDDSDKWLHLGMGEEFLRDWRRLQFNLNKRKAYDSPGKQINKRSDRLGLETSRIGRMK